VIAVDTNVLVHAHRRDAEWHRPARQTMQTLAEGAATWALPWPCIHEFIAIVTHPKIFVPPSTLAQALDQMDAWLASPSVVLLSESPGHWAALREQLEAGRIAGPMVHDGRVAAMCLSHGVTELWLADRDFSRFPALTVRNPLVGH
jgi:toxin-antitoxin system PIN domain toxin